jgi:uncharacterized membrane protein (UPF0127 family)
MAVNTFGQSPVSARYGGIVDTLGASRQNSAARAERKRNRMNEKQSVRCLPLAVALMTTALGACASGPSVELNGHRFEVEIAADDAARTRGLMFRDNMAADHGMLFVFDDEQPRAFWMKNTYIPLDMLFFDKDYRLVSVQQRVPPCRRDPCSSYASTGPARYVLELNSGLAEKLGVKAGDRLTVKR